MQWVSGVWEADTGRTLDTVNEPVSRAVLELIFRAPPVRKNSLITRFRGDEDHVFTAQIWNLVETDLPRELP